MNYNPFSLENKTILITGASSGIGRQVAIECSRQRAVLHLVARNKDNLLTTLNLLDGSGHQIHVCDIANDAALDELITSLPELDGFCNCVGISKGVLVKSLSRNSLSNILNVNTFSPIILTQKLVKKKIIKPKSSIVYISSLSGVYTVHYADSLNATSKGALSAFAKSAALDLSIQGIRVNCINPGVVATESAFSSTILTNDEMKEKQQYFPLKRFGRPEDIATAVVYLLSDASSWITGVNLPVDGGYTLL